MKKIGQQQFAFFISLLSLCAITIFQFYSLSQKRGFDWHYFDSLALIVRSSVLSYLTFPLHDPWVCSGVSLLSNPQNWIFSPSVFLTLLFPAYVGNILGIFIFKAFGFWGTYKYMRSKDMDKSIALLCAALFINSSWFALHIAEGHVVFRSFYLLPLAFFYIENLSSRKNLFQLGGLFSLMILDGGLYGFIFSLIYFLAFYLISWNKAKTLVSFLLKNIWFVIASIICFGLISAAKIFPVLSGVSNMKQDQEFQNLDLSILLSALFDPFLDNSSNVGGMFRFHEYGCYLGIFLFIILIFNLVNRAATNKDRTLIVLAFVFFWIASGIGDSFNPYQVISQIPLIKKAHVQSRYFIVFFLIFLTFIGSIASRVKSKKVVVSLFMLALAESLVPNFYAFSAAAENFDFPLITKSKWYFTHQYIPKPNIYYIEGVVSKLCYEPAQINSTSLSIDNPAYKGELMLLKGEAKFGQPSLTPGEITFSYESATGTHVLLNTNYLEGWDEINAGGETLNNQGLLEVKLPPGKGNVILHYQPFYYYWILLSLSLGLIALLKLRKYQ